jgi:hypothetical protein
MLKSRLLNASQWRLVHEQRRGFDELRRLAMREHDTRR